MSELINPFMHFQIIKDYRQESKVEHKLSDIILLTICGVLSGHDGWDGIIDFGNARLDFLKRYSHFEAGIPSADTLSSVMGMINPVALQRSFIAWMKDCHTLTDGEVIAIDGKTLRGSYDRSKGNQGMLEQAFDDYFRMDMLQDFDGSSYSTQEKSHGRIETRVALVNRNLSVLGDIEHEWPGLKSMGIVASIRQESAVATEQDVSILYYICSKELEAQTLLEATRSHWGVEVMHWSLDTAFCEDNSRIRADDRAEAFARIRQICLNLLKSETTFKGGFKRKRMNCAMDEKYLSKVLESLT